jgi:hypothetical protein
MYYRPTSVERSDLLREEAMVVLVHRQELWVAVARGSFARAVVIGLHGWEALDGSEYSSNGALVVKITNRAMAR